MTGIRINEIGSHRMLFAYRMRAVSWNQFKCEHMPRPRWLKDAVERHLLRGVAYSPSTLLTLTALSPFGPGTTSNSTDSPLTNVL